MEENRNKIMKTVFLRGWNKQIAGSSTLSNNNLFLHFPQIIVTSRSTHLNLLILMACKLAWGYFMRLRNWVHYMFIFTFLCSFLRDFFCTQLYHIKYSYLIKLNFIVIWFEVFLSNTNNHKVSSNYFYLMIVICLLTTNCFN